MRQFLEIPNPSPNLGASNALGWDSLRAGLKTRELAVPVGPFAINVGGNRPYLVEPSRWSEVLGELGYATTRIYEIPVSTEPETSVADEYIQSATTHFNRGDWRESLAASRNAVQALKRSLEATANPVNDWKENTAPEKTAELVAAFDGLVKSMTEYQGKLLTLMSAGSHPVKAGTSIERAEAEFALVTAYACRQYVGRRMLSPK
jgi:hypothetical protein